MPIALRWRPLSTGYLLTYLGQSLSHFASVAQYGSTWHTTSSSILSSYSVFSRYRTPAEIGGYIGLMHINITYSLTNYTDTDIIGDVEYNERFWWRSPTEMSESFREALYRGTPFPIISLAETCFAAWSLMNLLLVVVPRYGAYSMIFTGILMLFTNLIYWSLLPCEPLIAHVDGSVLVFSFGWNYWLVLVAGSSCLLSGIIITIIDLIFPHQFSTILEVDYDTPYDRHVIIEESFDTRNIPQKFPRVKENLYDQRSSSQLPSKGSDKKLHEGIVNRGYISHESSSDLHRDSDESNKANWSYPFPPISRRIN
ncbi:Similar to DUOXA1: Dual oxidase maturation factor 1 (Homo sapiens) [Cotesia congregata]|uniref:Similar to DUOXA1: Dual oxidase maturation factor 1 (Homo sapiens) n=1 Tax=Cotesia congregata TaxID=51543 RepID=A0A8J2HDD3_COTCN|nr:Similar to DUOXA1: Dual oxidase maturation factor 1 (Homo sapiens) [Cotesia congregata]